MAAVKHVYLDALIESFITMLGRLGNDSDAYITVAHEIQRLRKLQTDAGHADYYVRLAA